MNIDLDGPEGSPHWLSKSVTLCTCEKDYSYRNKITRLCPMHAAAPRLWRLVEKINRGDLGMVDIEREARAALRDLGRLPACTCRRCYAGEGCRGDRTVCATCGHCTRHDNHTPGCVGCPAGG